MTGDALSFGAVAEAYDRFRPDYPGPATSWAVDAPPSAQVADLAAASRARVVDLAAGTGIMTRCLLALGHHVVPVEPDPAMREQLAAATPGVTALAGRAEEIPLPDGSVDAVVAAQAYHWFDKDRAHREIARVLRPGGVFTALWNVRDDAVGWVRELSLITRGTGYSADSLTRGVESFGEWFAPIERAEFRHSTALTPDDLVAMMRTRSYYLTADNGRSTGRCAN